MNKRLPITTFMACTVLVLTGCGKSVSKEDAGKFIEENYTSKEEKTFNVHIVSNVEKADGIYSLLFKVGKETSDKTDKVAPITKLDLAVYSADYFKFTLKGKKLVVSYNIKNIKDFMKSMGEDASSIPEDAKFDGSSSGEYVYDENGYPESYTVKANVSLEYSYAGVSISGAIKMSEEAKYTAK